MIIGIDFDNTIVCYDQPFTVLANRLNISLSKDCDNPKSELKSELRKRKDGEWTWSKIQGEAYGARMMDAKPFDGFVEKVKRLLKDGHGIRIISHKTLYPTAGNAYDLRCATRKWIDKHLSCLHKTGFDPVNHISFHDTVEDKIGKIRSEGCSCFIDDLEEILFHPDFPKNCRPILFRSSSPNAASLANWPDLEINFKEAHPSFSSENAPTKTSFAKSNIFESLLKFPIHKVVPLKGGANSRVAELCTSNGQRFIGKSYPHDNRGRLEREVHFLETLSGTESVPTIIASNVDAQAIVLTKLEGQPFANNSHISSSHWSQCLEFLTYIQKYKNNYPHTSAEGAATLQSHIAHIAKRRNHWLQAALEAPSSDPLSKWVLEKLEPAFQQIARQAITSPLFRVKPPANSLILSPSDFGLHNTLVSDSGTLAFLDFEYAGLDDPAKTLTDFFCQPKFPPPNGLYTKWKTVLQSLIPTTEQTGFNERLPIVKACCAFKWIYIILQSNVTIDGQSTRYPIEMLNELQSRLDQILEA